MFRNKSLQVKLVNNDKNKNSDGTIESTPPVDYVQIVRDITESVGKKVIVGIAVYIVADTARQAIVKMTPSN